jgi:hypothetical protein
VPPVTPPPASRTWSKQIAAIKITRQKTCKIGSTFECDKFAVAFDNVNDNGRNGKNINNKQYTPYFNGRGGGRGNGRGFGRSSSVGGNGRGLGRSINGNGNGRDGNISKFSNNHPKSNSEAAGSAALKESGRKAVKNLDASDPKLLGADGTNIDKNPNSTDINTTVGNDNATVSF